MPGIDKYIKVGNTLYQNRNKPFVQRILMGDKQPVFGFDEQGRPMTHLMTSIDNFVLPSLQYDQKTQQWNDLREAPLDKMIGESLRSNNFIEFKSPEEANWFGTNYHFIMDNPGLIDKVKQNKKAFKKYITP